MDHHFHELDDLVLHLKGLVLVRDLQRNRGADEVELGMYSAEIDRVRTRLATLLEGGAVEQQSEGAAA